MGQNSLDQEKWMLATDELLLAGWQLSLIGKQIVLEFDQSICTSSQVKISSVSFWWKVFMNEPLLVGDRLFSENPYWLLSLTSCGRVMLDVLSCYVSCHFLYRVVWSSSCWYLSVRLSTKWVAAAAPTPARVWHAGQHRHISGSEW